MTTPDDETPNVSPIRCRLLAPVAHIPAPPCRIDGLPGPVTLPPDPRYRQELLPLTFAERPASQRPPDEDDLLPDPTTFGARVAVTLLEVIRGTCPPATARRLVSPDVLASLERRRMNDRSLRHRPAQVRRVVGNRPAGGVYEAAVVLDTGDRVHAMALRLVAARGRWCVTRMSLT